MLIQKIFNGLVFFMIMCFYMKCITVLVSIMLVVDFFVPKGRFRRFLVGKIKIVWLHLTMTAFSFYFPLPVYIQYDPRILTKHKNVIISNHLTEYDWIFVLVVLYKLKRFQEIRVMLKDSLRRIPLLGYGMKFFNFIFLNRKIEKDKQIINSSMNELKRQEYYDLLIFPEGTYIENSTFIKSKEYYKKNPVVLDGEFFEPEEVLMPRTTGYNCIKDILADEIDGIIDITLLMNPYSKFPSEKFSYIDVILNSNRNMSLVGFLEYIEDKNKIRDQNFMHKLFKKKEKLIKNYKNLFGYEGFRNIESFEFRSKELCNLKGRYETIYIRSEWCNLFKLFFFYFEIISIYIFYKVLYK